MADLSSILEQRLPPDQLALLRSAADFSSERGVDLYLVGGTVRDVLLGLRPGDPDLAAVGAGPPFAAALAERLDGELLASSQFGTWKLRVGSTRLDLVTARRESYSRPGALPRVEFGSIEEDLARRDFSVNAMAVSLGRATWGHLLDPFDGRSDLDGRRVRVLHPASFADDPTRMLRAVLYEQRLGFRLEPATERLLSEHLGHVDVVSGGRVRHELERILREAHVAPILRRCQDLGIIGAIYRSLSVEGRTLERVDEPDAVPPAERELVLLVLLTYSLSSSDRPGLIKRLNLGGDWARVVRDTGAVKDAMPELTSATLRSSKVYHQLRGHHPASVRGCSMATDDPLVSQRLGLYLDQLRHISTLLNGSDLLELGVPEGPMVGELLEELLEARLDGLLATREEEENLVLRSLERSGMP